MNYQAAYAKRMVRAKRALWANVVGALVLDGGAVYTIYLSSTLLAPLAQVAVAYSRQVIAQLVGLAVLEVVFSLAFWIYAYTWSRQPHFLGWVLAAFQVAAGAYQAPTTVAQPAVLPAEQVPSAATAFGPFAGATSHEARLNVVAGVILVTAALLVAGILIVAVTSFLAAIANIRVSVLDGQVRQSEGLFAFGLVAMGWTVLSGLRVILRNRRGAGSYFMVADEQAMASVPGKARGPRTARRLPALETIQARYLVGAVAGVLGLAAFASLAAGVPLVWVAGVVGILLVVLIVVALAWRGGQAHQPDQHAPAKGLGRMLRASFMRNPSRDPVTVAWSEMRGFFLLDHWRGLGGADHAVYGIQTGKRLIVWAISSHASAAILASHDTLCRLIVTRTGLALRDVRPVVSTVR